MLSKYPFRLLAAIAIMAIGALSMRTNNASAIFGKKCVDQTGCPCFTCPSCRHTCNLEAELVDAEKICFETEEKVICIPRVVFPWQKNKRACCGCTEQPCSNCTHNGAKTRKICVLKVKTYTCPECEYTWSPKEKECIPACGCADGCAVPGCTSPGCTGTPCDAVQLGLGPVESDRTSVDTPPLFPWNTDAPVIAELPNKHLIESATPAPISLP